MASLKDLAEMTSIPLDGVLLRLVIQAMASSVRDGFFCTSANRSKDLEMDFINVVKYALVGRIPFPIDIPMEEKYSLEYNLQPLNRSFLSRHVASNYKIGRLFLMCIIQFINCFPCFL